MRKVIVLLHSTLLLASFVATNVSAQEEAAEEAKEETPSQEAAAAGDEAGNKVEENLGVRQQNTGYGPAGCGLGSIIFEPDSGFTQIFAATTNGTSGNQTFGITTGTSNCDTGPGGSAATKTFIVANRSALAKDIARGSGETLSSMSHLAECQNAAAVGPTLQRNFSQIFPDESVSDAEVGERVLTVLKSSAELGCKNAG
jgi:hypothetical protein